ncbi:DNA-binding MarR family transcriptional regulator [Crossiella equi]|uniref:DNA-binding MarR family transcriptional regulator n=1 Tax=Crossiella equi TaxID=130796 RepID=A0ABS5AAJ0_9PSEU|nr:MarR family winged helix-turn-helix transcriptional regulator [Crossiella equi]MBP2473603.1 DNA-binding MarR family transcriptional regulator [Crossiella equi]
MTTQRTVQETEHAVRERLGELPLDFEAMAAVANIHRAAVAVRNHMEGVVLRPAGLTWTGFVVLWVVWIWGDMETRHVAAEAGITKGTLTGVVKTLESGGLIERREHAEDGRLVVLHLTVKGKRLMRKLFPAFNAEESFVVDEMSTGKRQQLATILRGLIGHLERDGESRRTAVRKQG